MKALKWLAALIVVLALGLWALGSMMVKNSQTAINTMLSERTGLQTQINGALGWRMLWPTAVTIEDISARDEAGTESWHLEQLRLELSPLHILQHPTAPERWRYQAVALQGLSGARGSAAAADAATSYQVDSFRLRGLEDGQAAPFEARLAYRDGAAAPVALQLSGQLRLSAENRQLKFEPALLAGDIADGKCNAEISLRPILPDSPEAPAAATDVLNLDRWRRTDWNLECALDRLRWAGAEFADVTLQSNNLAGISQSEVELPVFFSGSANLKMAVDTSPIDDRAGPRWVLTPVVDNVAAAQLDDWLAAALPQDPADAPATLGRPGERNRSHRDLGQRTLGDAAQRPGRDEPGEQQRHHRPHRDQAAHGRCGQRPAGLAGRHGPGSPVARSAGVPDPDRALGADRRTATAQRAAGQCALRNGGRHRGR
jgi:hypothetical protein